MEESEQLLSEQFEERGQRWKFEALLTPWTYILNEYGYLVLN
jgi:hypothetical protein